MTTMNALKRGATIIRGNFGGWYLALDGKKLKSLTSRQVYDLIDSKKITRIDDRSSVCGEEYAQPTNQSRG